MAEASRRGDAVVRALTFVLVALGAVVMGCTPDTGGGSPAATIEKLDTGGIQLIASGVSVVRDEKRAVTCYVYWGYGISCLHD